MRKNFSWGLLVVLLQLTQAAPARALVNLSKIETTKIKGAPLLSSVSLESTSVPLKRVAQGLRQKKVVLAWFSVYVAQFFSAQPTKTASIAEMKASLLAGLPVVVTMTFVRDVDIDKIIDGFKEVLTENKVEITEAPFQGYLDAVKKAGDVKEGQTYTFVFEQEKRKESFRFETLGKVFFSAQSLPSGTLGQFMNMWLGKPVDSGLEQLQKQLIQP